MNVEPDTITSNTYVAALAGAILGLKALPGGTFAERLANLIFGFLMAVFLGPAMVDYLHIASLRVASGLIFAVGAAGLVVFAALIDGVRQTPLGDVLSSWLPRRKGN